MSNLYKAAKEKFLSGDLNWVSGSFKVMLLADTYTPNFTTDTYLSDIPASRRIKSSGLLSGKTATLGVADANDITISSVTSSKTCNALLIYASTGVDATSTVIAYIDESDNEVFPFIPNGGNIEITWSNDSAKIFSL